VRLVLSLLLLSALGCGPERAVRVNFEVEVPAQQLCVLAGDGRASSFVGRYDVATLPRPASLTFAAGSPGRRDATVGAYALAGARVVGIGHLALDFDGGEERTLRVGRCRDAAGLGLRPSGTFTTLLAGTALEAADLDGDGREELLALAADGSLAVLDAEDPDLGSRRATELLARSGRLVGTGDLDGDCRLDVLASAPLGVLRVVGADGSSPAPFGEASPSDAAIVAPLPEAPPVVVVGGAAGAVLFDASGAEIGGLSNDPVAFLVTADLDGNGGGDVLVGGPAACRLYLASEGGFTEASDGGAGLLAPASGPAVAGDFDGDARQDVALLDGDALRVIRYDGAVGAIPGPGTLGDGVEVVRLVAGDLDGDCIDELVALEASGTVRVLSGITLAERGGPGVPATALAMADVDGDGARELALLGEAGRVTLWRP